jgi:DNA-binding transcriptional regulator YdaS (Cro superfamily)
MTWSHALSIRFEIHHNVVMKLRTYLMARKITQAEFGQMLSPPVSQGKVNHWLHGSRRVSLAEAIQIVNLTRGEVDLQSLAEMAASAAAAPVAEEDAHA